MYWYQQRSFFRALLLGSLVYCYMYIHRIEPDPLINYMSLEWKPQCSLTFQEVPMQAPLMIVSTIYMLFSITIYI